MNILDNNVMDAISSIQGNLKVNKAEISPASSYSSNGCSGSSCEGDCDYSCSDDGSCNVR